MLHLFGYVHERARPITSLALLRLRFMKNENMQRKMKNVGAAHRDPRMVHPAVRVLRFSFLVVLSGCRGSETEPKREVLPTSPSVAAPLPLSSSSTQPAALPTRANGPEIPADPTSMAPRCQSDMVLVAHRVCVDRYEASLVDAETNEAASPYYPPKRSLATSIQEHWTSARYTFGLSKTALMALPALPDWEKQHDVQPKAVSRRGQIPQGYVSGPLASLACKNADKRLCSIDEWRLACRGERDQAFPYGSRYEPGKCNVFREAHPAMVLHGNASVGHTDPRLNLVQVEGKPLLRATGETETCSSAWGEDGATDMVGNIDEWVDDPEGTFVGGFYARATKEGCRATISTHVFDYFDYSTGIRCCRDL